MEDDNRRTDGWSLFHGPDPKAAQPLELAARAEPVSTSVDDVEFARKKRRRLKVRRPKTYSLMMFGLAVIGALTVFGYLVKSLKMTAPDIVAAAMDIDIEKLLQGEPEAYRPPRGIVDGVLITLEVTPRDARIYLDGKAVQSNPVRVERSKAALEFLVWDVGYTPYKVKVTPSDDKTVAVRLTRAAAGARDRR